MSLFSFIKEAGEKLFGKAEAAQAGASPNVEELNRKAGEAIAAYIEQQNLGIQALDVKFDGASGKVTISGQAPTQDAAEKAVLCCGNVQNVASVDNLLTIAQPAEAAQFHDVVKGDTLSAISKKYYGDANKYNRIFEANRPMLSHPDKIYPGQKLRIPPA
ncbi:MAG: peptidoglycan-binding protein LysM [Ramlibacter sp.]|nr:peptidoglycan-binding protein LysM [Ramlibacter sp.]